MSRMTRLIASATILIVLAAVSYALGTGSMTIPNVLGSQPPGNYSASNLDANWNAARDYVNAREITIDLAANRPAAATAGRYYFATDTNGGTLYADTGTTWQQLSPSLNAVNVETLTGLTLANDGTESGKFSVAVGAGSSDDAAVANRVVMSLTSARTKSLAAWVVGTNQGCLDTGTAIASTWYHVFAIQRTDTGVVDVLCSTATSPTMPTNYTKKRRIGSLFTDGNVAINYFTQFGDEFVWATPSALNVNEAAEDAAAHTATATTPNGVIAQAILHAAMNNTANPRFVLYLSALASADVAPANNATPLGTLIGPVNAATTGAGGQARVWTDTSRQFRFRGSIAGADAFYIVTLGWRDLLRP